MSSKRKKRSRGPGATACVIGGGLAGMTVAKVLTEHGVQVTIFEGSDHLGGKASAVEHNGRWEDHGYHIFPAWYANTRALLDQLGCSKHLIDIHRTHSLKRGAFPRFITAVETSSLTNVLENLFNGVLPWADNLLSYYALMDLAAESFDQRAYLDRISGVGFLRSRFYATERVAAYHHNLVLQASSIPFYDLSAMTARKLFRLWMQKPTPVFSILDGNLQERFILPYQRYLEDRGVEVRLNCAVERLHLDHGRISGVSLQDGSTPPEAQAADAYVLALPHATTLEVASRSVVYEELSRGAGQDPQDETNDHLGLADLANLRSAPMAAFHVHLKRVVPGIPKEAVVFVGSRFGLNFIDIGPHWKLDHTALHMIASNFEPLHFLRDDEVKELLLSELREYIPAIQESDLPDDRGYLQTHIAQPLFLNTVAAWHYRPQSTTLIDNLFVAGDYCRTQADLTCMESAVMSGINTGGEILRRLDITDGAAAQPLAEPDAWMLTIARYAALPLIAPVALWKRAEAELQRWQQGPES
jgi:uncharacterized protein with NAD-binding domain and iron-sulfur cluster